MPASPIKILIVAESPVLPTGMGETIRLIFGALLDHCPGCYDLHQLALFHTYAVAQARWPIFPTKGILGTDGRLQYIDVTDASGTITFPEIVRELRPDIVFAFNDPQRVLHLCLPPEERNYRLVLYLNFDGMPFPAGGAGRLINADFIVTMTEFSRRVLLAALPDLDEARVTFMYPPADMDRFKPVSQEQKRRLREKWFPSWMPYDAFVLGWVGRNQWRKQVWVMYEVIAHLRHGGYFVCEDCGRVLLQGIKPHSEIPFCRQRQGSCKLSQASGMPNVFLWIHMIDEASNDWRKEDLEMAYGLKPGKDLFYTSEHAVGKWTGVAEMAELYGLWDGLLYLSGGEGFGLPAWEAMICGLPVIYTNYSGHADFLSLGKGGLPVGGILQPESDTCILRMIADVPQALEAVLALKKKTSTGCFRSNNRFVEKYTSKEVAHTWHETFQGILRGNAALGK